MMAMRERMSTDFEKRRGIGKKDEIPSNVVGESAFLGVITSHSHGLWSL
jgi:hypothetical protein